MVSKFYKKENLPTILAAMFFCVAVFYSQRMFVGCAIVIFMAALLVAKMLVLKSTPK